MIKKRKKIVIFLFLIILISSVILTKYIGDLDELWNFSFAKNIASGKLPYKDFNMVTTPLLPIICGLVLKIFSTNLIVMRVLAVFIISMIFIITYNILLKLEIKESLSGIGILGIYFVLKKYFCIDYNYANLFINLLIIYIELENVDNYKFKTNFIIGIIAGVSILFKQTTGIALSLVCIFNRLFLMDKKENIKHIFKNILYRFLGAIIPLILLTIYISINDLWYVFLDYTIYGIKTFSNYISYVNLIKNGNIIIKILSVLAPILIFITGIYCFIKFLYKKIDKKIYVLFCYSIASFILVYPISDEIHFLIGMFPIFILIFYFINILLNINKIDILMEIINDSLWIFFVLISIFNMYNFLSNVNYSSLNHYKFIPSDMDESIIEIDNYILAQNQKIYILDASSAIYMIPIDKCNKDYDLFLKGNLGAGGEDKQILNLNFEENIKVLLLKPEYNKNWQTPTKVINYIEENWKKIDEISIFNVYERGI